MNKSKLKTRREIFCGLNNVVCRTCKNDFYVDFARCNFSTNEEQTQLYASTYCPYCKTETKVIM